MIPQFINECALPRGHHLDWHSELNGAFFFHGIYDRNTITMATRKPAVRTIRTISHQRRSDCETLCAAVLIMGLQP